MRSLTPAALAACLRSTPALAGGSFDGTWRREREQDGHRLN